ncbi:hypothetical protein V5F29_18645 [Xanthobacter aminoxidans]|uniref:hypothetical protein n=1 Tax=Xanthobacter aminoxidans TaxID=186280 RepID=UPI00372A1358
MRYGDVLIGKWNSSLWAADLALARTPFTRLQARAALRLEEIADLARLRHRVGGEVELGGLIEVAADALHALDGTGHLAPTENDLRGQVPPGLEANADELKAALARARPRGRILTNERAGILLQLTGSERAALDADGVPIRTMTPIGETAGERADRDREKTRLRNIRWRETKRQQRANGVTAESITSNANFTFSVTGLSKEKKQRHAANFTFRTGKGPEAVLGAVLAGCTTIPEIAAFSGADTEVVKQALGRLVRNGLIVKFSRGRYCP